MGNDAGPSSPKLKLAARGVGAEHAFSFCMFFKKIEHFPSETVINNFLKDNMAVNVKKINNCLTRGLRSVLIFHFCVKRMLLTLRIELTLALSPLELIAMCMVFD